MKLSEKKTIEKEKLIIVEGGDDDNFIDALLKKLEINDIEIINSDILVINKVDLRILFLLTCFFIFVPCL